MKTVLFFLSALLAVSSAFTGSIASFGVARSASKMYMNAKERTYIMVRSLYRNIDLLKIMESNYCLRSQVKPDGVQRGLVGGIINRFESRGYKLTGMKIRMASKEILEQHYCDLVEKPFFPGMRDYMLSGPVCW